MWLWSEQYPVALLRGRFIQEEGLEYIDFSADENKLIQECVMKVLSDNFSPIKGI
jgi:hypothetical protein